MVDEWTVFFNGENNFQLVANQDEILDEPLNELFKEGIING